jgi:hypothetical protein
MTLEEFAKDAGCVLVDCGPGWGGRIGYSTKDCPSSSVCGFKTKKSAYSRWLSDSFGEHTSKAILRLLATSK